MLKLAKYYTLYDCINTDEVYDTLNKLQDKEKIEYEMLENNTYQAFRIKDLSLNESETKSLLLFFSKNDVAEYEYASEDLSVLEDIDDYDDELENWESDNLWSESDYDDDL